VDTAQIRVERDGAIGRLSFARPASLNAITPILLEEAIQAIDELAVDDSVRVIVLSGEGRAFCAGVDLKVMSSPGITGDDIERFNVLARRFTARIEAIAQPVIARIHGACMTGGLEIALACDLMIVADEAMFGDTHASLGLYPKWGLSQRLPRRIGDQRARELSYTGRRIDGREAAAIGLALRSVPMAELDAAVDALASSIARNSAGAVAAYKALFREAQQRTLDDGLAFEAAARFKVADRKQRALARAAQLNAPKGNPGDSGCN